jgi:Zn-dependent protease
MDPQMVQYIREGAVYLIALILSICVHEFGHAFVADRLGDPLPRSQGRVTLNPISHIDFIGTLVLPVVAFAMSISDPAVGAKILGWGKPVQISLSPRAISRKITLKTAHLLIALAGPMMNLLFGLVLSILYVGLVKLGGSAAFHFALPILYVIEMNIGLAFFNLIPCPPLDGGAILRGILPRGMERVSDVLEKWGVVLLFGLLMTGALAYFMLPAEWLSDRWLGLVTMVAR